MSGESNRTAPAVDHAQLRDVMHLALAADVPLLVHGSPGIGKTEGAGQFAEEIDRGLLAESAAMMDYLDGKGLPYVVDGQTRFSSSPLISRLISDRTWIVLFDDVTNADRATQGALYQAVCERRMGEHAMPAGTWVMACGNRAFDGAGTNRLSSALDNRMVHVTLEPTAADHERYALGLPKPPRAPLPFDRIRGQGEHPSVIGFLRNNGGLRIQKQAPGEHAFATLRSWSYASRLLHACDVAREIWGEDLTLVEFALLAGVIGQGTAASLRAFLHTSRSGYSLDGILTNPRTAPIPGDEDPGMRYAITVGLSMRATPGNIGAALHYVERIGSEYVIIAIKTISARDQRAFKAAEAAGDESFRSLTKTRGWVEANAKHNIF